MAKFVEIIKHGRNYLIANLATKALAFISIPIYTRLLTTEDFGIVSVFLGVVGILNNLFTLGTDCAVSRYYFDKKNNIDFKSFVGTSVIFSFGLFIINSLIFCFFAKEIASMVKLPVYVIYLIIPVVFINVMGLMFEQIYNPQKKSLIIAKSSLYRVYLGFGFSIIFILILSHEKFYGQIFGQIVAGIFLSLFWIKKIYPYFKFVFIKKHLRYILIYSLPLIPYSMSGVLIEQFGKLTIGRSVSLSDAGYYSLALSISGLVAIIISVAHQAWNPFYFEYMNSKNYNQHDNDQNRIFRITIIVAAFLAAFGLEVGLLLAKSNFTGALYLIPIMVIGYVFYQLAYVYMRNFGYTRKTIYSTLTVCVSSIINILINLYAIPKYGEIGAAISFVISYISMAFIAWFFNKYIIKFYTTPLKLFLFPLIWVSPFFLILYFINILDNYVLSIILRMFIFISICIILLWKERSTIIQLLKKLLIKSPTSK